MKRPRSSNKYANGDKHQNNAVRTSKSSKSVQRILAGICAASMVPNVNSYVNVKEDK